MQIFSKTDEFIGFRKSLRTSSIGLVATMGNLHQGHLNLVQNALNQNETVIVTIFVNPKQFGPNEDFKKYPRTLSSDIEKLKSLEEYNKIILFCPESPREVYPEGHSTEIEVKNLDDSLCGKNRPGHFKGVCTVVHRLFQLTKPHIAYFGQKDFQQFKIIEKMTFDLEIPIKIKMIPIARDKDGLALSSRNQYLSKEHRMQATTLKNALENIVTIAQDDFRKAIGLAKERVENDKRFQYIEVLDAHTLKTPSMETKNLVVAGAFILGDTRLIDNILLNLKD